jgi:hypothetical protein
MLLLLSSRHAVKLMVVRWSIENHCCLTIVVFLRLAGYKKLGDIDTFKRCDSAHVIWHVISRLWMYVAFTFSLTRLYFVRKSYQKLNCRYSECDNWCHTLNTATLYTSRQGCTAVGVQVHLSLCICQLYYHGTKSYFLYIQETQRK